MRSDRQLLLGVLKSAQPSPQVGSTLRDWVVNQTWASDPAKVIRAIRSKRREHADDVEIRLLCTLMLREVESRTESAG